jgi:hypothetical protein
MDLQVLGSSCKPYTTVRMPAMWKVLEEIGGGGIGYVPESGFEVAIS